MNKYKLEKDLPSGLYRIVALKDFGDVEKGDVGGLIESEKNLSQEGNAWVYEDASVYENAMVYGNAWVSGNANVYGDATVYGDAGVYGKARVYGDARVCGNACVDGDTKLPTGYCFGYKMNSWDVTEVPVDRGVLLVKDYEAPPVFNHSITIDGQEIGISDESYEEFRKVLNLSPVK